MRIALALSALASRNVLRGVDRCGLRINVASVVAILAVAGCAPEYAKSGHVAASNKPSSVAQAERKHSRRIPMPTQALLAPEPEPSCGSTAASLRVEKGRIAHSGGASVQLASLGTRDSTAATTVVDDGPPPAAAQLKRTDPVLAQAGPDDNLVLLTRLALEAECYRRAEAAVRKRLHELQAAVAETVKAVNARDDNSAKPAVPEVR